MNPRKLYTPDGVDARGQFEAAIALGRSESVEFHPHAQTEPCRDGCIAVSPARNP